MVDDFFDEDNPSKIKRAVIAGASHALREKGKNYRKEDSEILQEITDKVEEIIGEID